MPLLPENTILFGRQADLEYLERRARTQGLTFVLGRVRVFSGPFKVW